MEVSITYADGDERRERIIPVDLVAFERHYSMGWEAVRESPKVEHTLFLAWNSAKRCGRTTLDFDEWMATVVDIGDDEGDTGEGGTPLAPSSDS